MSLNGFLQDLRVLILHMCNLYFIAYLCWLVTCKQYECHNLGLHMQNCSFYLKIAVLIVFTSLASSHAYMVFVNILRGFPFNWSPFPGDAVLGNL